MTNKKSGFTLLEIAVVLLVIALVAGGIVMGSTLIRSSAVKETMNEYTRNIQAIGEFQQKYFSLPGDLNTAQTYWGTAAACPATASTLTITTCNGNGDGRIGTSTSAGVIDPNGEEWFTAWQHLANAGFIPGMYSGAKGAAGTSAADVGTNVPSSKLAPGGWSILYWQQRSNSANLWADNYGHMFVLGAADSSQNVPTFYPLFTPLEAMEIDTKLDDGLPGMGKVRSMRRSNTYTPNCIATDAAAATDLYDTSYTQTACALIFIPGF